MKGVLGAASIGIELVTAVFIGAALGYLVDKWLKTAPWGMVVGVVLGSIAGIWNAVKLALKENEHSS